MSFELISRLFRGDTLKTQHSDMSTAPTTHSPPVPAKTPVTHSEMGEPGDAGAEGHARKGITISMEDGRPPALPPRTGYTSGPQTYDYDGQVGEDLHCYCCHETQEKLRDAQTREGGTTTQLRRDLEAKAKENAQELADLRDALNLSQKRLEATQAEREDVRRRWKQSTKELRQLTRPQHVGFQVTDDDLVKWTMQLRLMIRDFTIRHFECDGGPRTGFNRAMEESERGMYHFLMKGTTPGTRDYEVFLSSPSRCSSVIQAFMWHVLKQRVFTRFRWAEEVSKEAHALYRYFYDGKPYASLVLSGLHQSRASCSLLMANTVFSPELINSPAPADAEAIKRFKLWSVSTTALLQDCVSGNTQTRPEDPKENNIFKSIVLRAHDVISPFTAPHSDPHACIAELEEILVRALAFDRDICRQAADVTWEFGHAEGETFFDPATMAVERGERAPGVGDEALLVVAPGVYKLGKSNGDGFEGERQMVLRASVTCREVEDGQISGLYGAY